MKVHKHIVTKWKWPTELPDGVELVCQRSHDSRDKGFAIRNGETVKFIKNLDAGYNSEDFEGSYCTINILVSDRYGKVHEDIAWDDYYKVNGDTAKTYVILGKNCITEIVEVAND